MKKDVKLTEFDYIKTCVIMCGWELEHDILSSSQDLYVGKPDEFDWRFRIVHHYYSNTYDFDDFTSTSKSFEKKEFNTLKELEEHVINLL